MKTLIVLKDVAYAAKNGGGTITSVGDILNLAPGALAFVNDDGTLATANGTNMDAVTTFICGRLESTANPTISPRILRDKVLTITSKSYTAPVYPKVILGSDGNTATLTSGALVAGVEYEVTTGSTTFNPGATLVMVGTNGTTLSGVSTLIVGDRFKVTTAGTPSAWGSAALRPTGYLASLNFPTLASGLDATVVVRYFNNSTDIAAKEILFNVDVTSSDTVTTIINKMVAKINAASLPFTATAVGTSPAVGLSITGSNLKELQIYGQGIFERSTRLANGRGASISLYAGSGTYNQCVEIENFYNTWLGNANSPSVLNKTWKKGSLLDSTKTYDMHTIITEQDAKDPISVDKGVITHEILVLVPSDASTFSKANFATMLASLKQ